MDIKQSKSGSVGNIILTGRFDATQHRAFKEVFMGLLADKGVSAVEVNLADVTYLDSAAMGTLLLMREEALEVSKKISLRSPNAHISQILDIANFRKLFAVT